MRDRRIDPRKYAANAGECFTTAFCCAISAWTGSYLVAVFVFVVGLACFYGAVEHQRRTPPIDGTPGASS